MKKTAGLLCADTKGFSKLDERGQGVVANRLRWFIDTHLNKENSFFCKMLGDGVLIFSDDPCDSLEIALALRDAYRNFNWKRHGVSLRMQLRIALHAVTIEITDNAGEIGDVQGGEVVTVTRMEPIVDPDEIYCSRAFIELARVRCGNLATFENIGQRNLPKDYGAIELFKVAATQENYRVSEAAVERLAPEKERIPGTILRRKPTQRDKDKYLRESLLSIIGYFKRGLNQLDSQNPDVDTEIEEVSRRNWEVRVYFKGEIAAECRIWIGPLGDYGIAYYEGNLSMNRNAYNELLTIDDDSKELKLHASMGKYFSDVGSESLTAEEAAEYLWKRLIKILEGQIDR
jgi:class 3 adenylate cyclase